MPKEPERTYIRRSQVELHNGLLQKAKLTVEIPAVGTLNMNGCRKLRLVSARRGGPALPTVLEVAVDLTGGRLVLVPAEADPTDAFAVRWAGETRAYVNLAEAYLEAHLVVPQGHVQEIPVQAEQIDRYGGWCLVADLNRAVFRPIVPRARTRAKAARRKEAAAARQEAAAVKQEAAAARQEATAARQEAGAASPAATAARQENQ